MYNAKHGTKTIASEHIKKIMNRHGRIASAYENNGSYIINYDFTDLREPISRIINKFGGKIKVIYPDGFLLLAERISNYLGYKNYGAIEPIIAKFTKGKELYLDNNYSLAEDILQKTNEL